MRSKKPVDPDKDVDCVVDNHIFGNIYALLLPELLLLFFFLEFKKLLGTYSILINLVGRIRVRLILS